MNIAQATARVIVASGKAWTKKWSFFGFFALAFVGSTSTLASFDLLPNPITVDEAKAEGTVSTTHSMATSSAATVASVTELPMKIEIPSISLSVSVANPESTDIAVLDDALLSGAVRYPASAKLGEIGNVVIFGHSSYLPVIHNQAFKAFDGIQKLHGGDMITVASSHAEYTYRVRSVTKQNAESDAIPLTVTGKELTLATCNSFGTKSDRFVVVADFIDSHLISE